MSTEVHDLLVRARKRIEKPENWTQGTLARSVRGAGVMGQSDNAVCWCALGALDAESRSSIASFAAEEALCRALGSRSGRHTAREVSGFNDSHTHAEVLALFDKAIEATA